jgi:mannosyl-oligosaccharide alpha-1,3-glucosidase
VTVKHKDFKRCEQSGFCTRNRKLADSVAANGDPYLSPYHVDPKSIKASKGQLEATVIKKTPTIETFTFPLVVSFLESGVARVTLDEGKRQKGQIELRHGSKARKERYNEAAVWALTGTGLKNDAKIKLSNEEDGFTKITYGPDNRFEAILRHTPFGIEFRKDGQKQVKLNDRGFLNMEHWRAKIEKPQVEDEDAQAPLTSSEEDESTWWDETFNGNTDSKPRGPESMAMDVTFFGYEHVYGLAEHASSLSLKQTRGGEGNFDQPYRLFNSDVFEYDLDSPMTLYGSIPFMQAHKKDSSTGIFWLNGAETWVDIAKSKSTANTLSMGLGGHIDTQTHWMSESGLLDVFVMIGSTPADISQVYGELTGYSQLPQSFAIAYHQCRWNYISDEDVKDVDRKFDKHNIPYDVIWLDLEWTDGRRWFRWDQHSFPDPMSMNKQLDETERKLVVLTDPHIKNEGGYFVDDELKSKGLAVKNKDGDNYEGWCWPGSSHWIDAFNPLAQSWWKTLFTYDRFKGTMSNVWLWNDMNEPSVFGGPDMTMPRDNLHHEGWEHRDLHNINGLTFHNATYHAVLERKKGEVLRPFVLTRSFFAGSQRVGAMWTGDNQAEWSHLQASIPMTLNQGVSGFPFGGADVGGFFGNPSKELLTRWYQAGAFYPFFRAHAHIDTRRREPYLSGEPYTPIMAQAIRLRYQLLPAWYTAFHESSVNGSPIVRAQYYVHPSDERGFAIDDQFYVGSTGLLVKPVTAESATSVDIYLADDEKYYDYHDYSVYHGAGKTVTIDAPLEKIPLLMQGGHIIPRKDRPRKSSGLMKWDPYTMVVVLDKDSKAEGSLYVDDGETFNFEKGAYIHRRFVFDDSGLRSSDLGTTGAKTAEYLKTMAKVRVERVIVVNAPKSWEDKSSVLVMEEGSKSGTIASLSWHAGADGKAAWAVVRNPGVTVGKDWKIDFS